MNKRFEFSEQSGASSEASCGCVIFNKLVNNLVKRSEL